MTQYIVTNITANPITFDTLDDLVLAAGQTLDLLSLEFSIRDLEDNEEIAQYLISDITAKDENNNTINSNTAVINADDLSILYQPSNYNPSTINRINTLDAHLKGIDNRSLNSNIFGSEYTYSQSLADSINTDNNTWLSKTSINNTFIAATYKVIVTYKWSLDSTSKDFEARLLLDNNLIGDIHKQEAKDKSGNVGSRGTDQRYCSTQSFIVNLNGVHNIDFQFKPSKRGVEASCFDALLEIYRVI